jgi:proteic killer suppression protein
MIQSFKNSEIEEKSPAKSHKLPVDIQQTALRNLRMINNADSLNNLPIPPANHLGKLAGNREGQHSTMPQF